MSRDLGGPKSAKGGWRPSFQTVQALSVLGLLAAICIVASIRSATFFSWQNLVYNVLTNAAYLGIIACGMTLVMVAGGFDLSVGSTTTVCSVAAVLTLQAMAGQPVWLAIAVAVAVTTATGVVLGAVNGASVAYVGVNPFVTTLSTMLIFRGIGLILAHGGQTLSVPLAFKSVVGRIYWGKVSLFGVAEYQVTIPILIFVGVFAVSLYLLHLTRFGHYVYAVGGNENASWLAGINTSLVKAATYAICGLTCALAAVIYTGMSNTAQASSYGGLELVVIASVIVGGTPLGGGSGGLFFTLIGLLLLSVIENLLPQFGVQEEYRNIVRGLIILIVVAVDVLVRGSGKKARST